MNPRRGINLLTPLETDLPLHAFGWPECWQEIHRLRKDMHRLFDRLRTLSPANQAVPVNVKQIAALALEYSADVTGQNLHRVGGRNRSNQAAWARHVAIYCTREVTGASLVDLTRAFRFFDHNTIKYALKKVRQEPDKKYRAQVEDVMARLRCALIGQPLITAGKPLSPQRLKKMREEKS